MGRIHSVAPSLTENHLMKSRFAVLLHTAAPLLLASTAFAASTSINTGSLGAAANGTNSDTVTVVSGVLGGADKAASYSNTASPAAITTIPYQSALNPASGSAFTIEFWANPSISNNNNAPVSNRVSSGNRSGWAFFQRAEAAGWNFVMYNGASSGRGWDLTGGTAPLNAWSHVVATWNGSAATLYVNGALADNTNSPNGAVAYNASLTATFAAGGLADSNSPYGGLLDEVAFYGTALTPTQIQNHFNLVSSNPGSYQSTVLADGARLQLTNVPEPTVIGLLGLSGLALLRRRSRTAA